MAFRERVASLLQTDPREADRLSAAFLRIARNSPDVHAGVLAIAHRARAEALLYTGRLKAARVSYETACSLAGTARDTHLLGQILVGRIGALFVMGDDRGGGALIPRAKRLLEKHGDTDYLRRLYINIGSGYYHRERYREAYEANLKAIRLIEDAGQRDHVWASLMLNHGIACTQVSRIEEARECFQRAEEFGSAHGLELLVAHARFNLGAMEGLRGDYRQSFRLLAEAEIVLSRLGARDLAAACCLEQAQLHLDVGMPVEAGELAGRAEASFAEEEMVLDLQLARLAGARGLLMLNRSEEAVRTLKGIEHLYQERDLLPSLGRILLELSHAYLRLGDLEHAQESANRAIRIGHRRYLPVLEASARCVLAEINLRRGVPRSAWRMLRPAAATVSRLPVQVRLEFWLAAARISRAASDRREALVRYRRAADCVEAKRQLIPGFEYRARSFDRDVQVYLEMIALLCETPRVRFDAVFDLMESARGRAFKEIPGMPVQSFGESIAQERAELSSLLRNLEAAESSSSSVLQQDAPRVRRRIRILERRVSSRLRRLETSTPSALRSPAARSGRLMGALHKGEIVIEYFVTPNRIVAAAVTNRTRSIHLLDAPPGVVRALLDRVHLQMNTLATLAGSDCSVSEFQRGQIEGHLGRLYDCLLRPVLGEVPRFERVVLIAHGLLHEVPFESMISDGSYLDDACEILRCPTADFLIERRSIPMRKKAGPVVVIAGSHPGSPMIEREAQQTAAIWSNDDVQLLIDPEPAQVLGALESARVVHLSGHGVFRRDNPLFSTLRFPGGSLFLADLLDVPSSADLVVLSACSTGEVFSGPGDSLLGVAHAFLAGGSRFLVAAQRRVHDRATAEWMDHFHRNYRERGEPGAAARAARRAVRKSWPHPFYWGGFCIFGA